MPNLNLLQRHLAFAAIAPTTLRGMLPVGARPLVCEALATLPLAELTNAEFAPLLDDWTDQLRDKIDAAWGPMRKALNLFLRDASYNVWTRDAFALDQVEPLLEIPLDGIVMRQLRARTRHSLATVPVIGLTEAISDTYQDAATLLAREKGELRVHLDLELWNGGIVS